MELGIFPWCKFYGNWFNTIIIHINQVSAEKLATTTMKLALMSKEADKIMRERRTWENKTENNAMELESLENAGKTAKNMGEHEQFIHMADLTWLWKPTSEVFIKAKKSVQF